MYICALFVQFYSFMTVECWEVLLYPGSSGVVPYCNLMVHKLVHVLSVASLRLLWDLVFSGGCLCYFSCLWCVTVLWLQV
jgi:hypothetical protein